MNTRTAIVAGRIGSILAVLALCFLLIADLAPLVTGHRFEADVYYLPLRQIPLGEHREAVEQSIIDTSKSLYAQARVVYLVVHTTALAGCFLACLAVWRMQLPPPNNSPD